MVVGPSFFTHRKMKRELQSRPEWWKRAIIFLILSSLAISHADIRRSQKLFIKLPHAKNWMVKLFGIQILSKKVSLLKAAIHSAIRKIQFMILIWLMVRPVRFQTPKWWSHLWLRDSTSGKTGTNLPSVPLIITARVTIPVYGGEAQYPNSA